MSRICFLLPVVLAAGLLASCKKKIAGEEPVATPFYLPHTITISGSIEPDLNGTVQFTYNEDRQITAIRQFAKSGNETLNWTYTYNNNKRLTHVIYTLNNALSSPSHFQTDYTYEYTGDTPVKVTVVFSDNLGSSETVVADITKPATDRFYLWTTNYTYSLRGDWLNGSGSLIEGSGVAATYSDKDGVFADVERAAAQYFFLDRKPVTCLLLFAARELTALRINTPSVVGWAGDYNAITSERNGQGMISKYIIKNNTKTYAQFDIAYTAVQP